MSYFDKIYEKTVRIEGGFSNHPNDRGGMTFCGISRIHHPNWPGWITIDSLLDNNVPPGEWKKNGWLMSLVRHFYREEFWQKLWLEDFPYPIAAEIFDSAVNCGKSRAIKWLQESMNDLAAKPPILKVDGIIGDKTRIKTLMRISNYGHGALLKCLNGYQWEHYRDLQRDDPSQRVFFQGWLTRVWEEH